MSEMTRDDIRSILLKKDPNSVKRIPIEFKGTKFDLMAPDVASRRNLLLKAKASTPEGAGATDSLLVVAEWLTIRNIVMPGTTERIFDDEDYNTILGLEIGGLVDKVLDHTAVIMNIVPGDSLDPNFPGGED